MKTRFIACIATVMLTAFCLFFLPDHPLVSVGEILLGASCLIQGVLIINHTIRKED